ncbi:hypothetical protein [Yoonia sp.]|uniref:outer membrane protein n=1 Tax=Yoonia sp. TaxID=2212373 RepID=UPI001A08064A|nr:hypothetical protein [Yoonia sp.]MBE0412473.1 hypothetical protein [Yoonia sp.]
MKKLLILAGALAIGTSAAAQEFYGGLTLDYAKPHSGDSQTAASLLGGVMFGGPVFKYGAELDFGLPLAGDTDYDTTRLRAMASYDFGDYAAIAGAGVVQYDTPLGDVDGQSLSLGVQRAISDRILLRGEFIRDFMDDGVADTTTTRVGAVYRFY